MGSPIPPSLGTVCPQTPESVTQQQGSPLGDILMPERLARVLIAPREIELTGSLFPSTYLSIHKRVVSLEVQPFR